MNDGCDGQSKCVLSDSVSVISLPVQLLLCRNLWPIFLVMVIIVTLVVASAGWPWRWQSLRTGGVSHISRRKSLGPATAGCKASHSAPLPPPAWIHTAGCSWGTGGGEVRQCRPVPRPHGRCPRGRKQLLPRIEEDLKGDGNWGCVGGSGLQQATAWGDPKGIILPGWFLLSYTEKKEAIHGHRLLQTLSPRPDQSLRCHLWSSQQPRTGQPETGGLVDSRSVQCHQPWEASLHGQDATVFLMGLARARCGAAECGGDNVPIITVQ